MRVVWLREFGGPEVLVPGVADEPVAGPGQLVVDVEFVNVTFVETQIRGGKGPYPVSLPMIPGNGVGGTVSSIGDGVPADLLGALVVTSTGGKGAYAERVAVDATAVFLVPEGRTLDQAVALLADGRTATMMARAADVKPGERVLVEAAAGGVGSLLVQLLKSSGAEVVGAVGSARKAAIASELGADLVVDYSRVGWEAQVGGIDVVFDGVGGEIGRAAFELLRPGGRMVSFGLASGRWVSISDDEASARDVRLVRPSATAEEMRGFTSDALHGALRPLIGQRFSLEKAFDAHAAIESRATVGKTLLEVR